MQKFKEVQLGWQTFIRAKHSFKISIIFSFALFTIICLIQNGNNSFQVFSFTTLSFFERITLFISTLFNVTTSFTFTALLISVVGSVFSGISIAVAYEYFLIRKQTIDKGTMAFTSIAYIFVIVGIQCAACSLVVVTLLISLFGNLIVPSVFMSLSIWFGALGILVQIVVLWLLLGKLSKPLTC